MENTVVKIDNLVKRYGDLIALDHFSLDINQGEIFGLLGPNGSGKTTTINCLLSLLSFDKGNISIFGKKMTKEERKAKKEAKKAAKLAAKNASSSPEIPAPQDENEKP